MYLDNGTKVTMDQELHCISTIAQRATQNGILSIVTRRSSHDLESINLFLHHSYHNLKQHSTNFFRIS